MLLTEAETLATGLLGPPKAGTARARAKTRLRDRTRYRFFICAPLDGFRSNGPAQRQGHHMGLAGRLTRIRTFYRCPANQPTSAGEAPSLTAAQRSRARSATAASTRPVVL